MALYTASLSSLSTYTLLLSIEPLDLHRCAESGLLTHTHTLTRTLSLSYRAFDMHRRPKHHGTLGRTLLPLGTGAGLALG